MENQRIEENPTILERCIAFGRVVLSPFRGIGDINVHEGRLRGRLMPAEYRRLTEDAPELTDTANPEI